MFAQFKWKKLDPKLYSAAFYIAKHAYMYKWVFMKANQNKIAKQR